MSLQEVFKVILSLSLMGSIVAAAIFLLKRLFGKRLSPGWHYYIWMLLVLRLTLPYTPQIPLPGISFSSYMPIHDFSPYKPEIKAEGDTLLPPKQGNNTSETKVIENAPGGAQVPRDESTGRTVVQEEARGLNYRIVSIVWLAGVLAMLVYFLSIHIWLRKTLHRQIQCSDADINRILEECRQRTGVRTPVSIVYDTCERTPFLFGLLRPKLLLSSKVADKLTQEEIRYVFLHELVHLKRKDVWVNWISILVQSLHWFNPLIWYAFYKMRQDCEVSCDAQVLRHIHPEEHVRYGQTLINLVKVFSISGSIPGTTGITERSQTKRRIIMISMPIKKSARRSIGAAVLTVTIAALGLLVGCSEKVTPKQDSPVLSQPAQNTPAATSSDKQKNVMDEFKAMVAKNATLPEMISFVSKNISSVSSENASGMVVQLEELQKKYLPKLEEKYSTEDIQKKINAVYKPGFDISKLEGIQDKELKDLLVETRDSGYKIETAEGMYFPITHYELYKAYSGNVTPDLREYISIMAVESNKVPLKDAGLMISWEEVLNRAFNQEKFLNTYKNSVKANDVKSLLDRYMSHIFFGTNNTPLFSYETKEMVPEAKAAYEKGMANNKDTVLAKALNGFMEQVKKSNYKLTDAVDKFRKDTLTATQF